MRDETQPWVRLAALVALIEASPTKTLGRTSIVKLPYLLQELQGIDLGYSFRMYTYGPYDAEVLNDISSAESLAAVSVKTVVYPRGYGYEIRVEAGAEAIKARALSWLQTHHESIAAVASEFGGQSAAELELVSTIVYLDREARQGEETQTPDTLARKVLAIKPHFSQATILSRIAGLRAKGYLTGLSTASELVGS
jgi:uncharacterized protein YwgA